jgi:hypothetical protein
MTPTPTMLETVARELAGHFGPEFDALPKDRGVLRDVRRHSVVYSDNTQDCLLHAARAVLQAMRTPTMQMKLTGARAVTAQMTGPGSPADYDAAADCWQAMITEALNEGEG